MFTSEELGHDIDVEIGNPRGFDEFLDDLSFAAAHGRIEIVKVLLESGADPNALSGRFNPTTPLWMAVNANKPEIIRLLIDGGAEVDCLDIIGTTPLMRAASLGLIESVYALLERGADVNARDQANATPLMWAVVSYRLDVIKALLDAGANADAQDNRGSTAAMRAIHNRPSRLTLGKSEFSFTRKNPNNEIYRLLRESERKRA